jgi:hypothetical protein
MRKVSFIAVSISLAMGLGSCSGGEGGDTVAESPSPAAEQSTAASPEAAVSPSPASTQPTTGTQRQNRPRGITPPDLIGSTNPDQRLRSIQSARPDPFALVQANPSVTITRTAQPSSGGGSPTGVSPIQSSGGSSSGSSGPTRVAMVPQTIPVLPETPRLPRALPAALAPQPELARAVGVSGVVQIGGIVYAIVDAPDEPSSRYVQVGQRLSNGEVLVRRIDFDGSDSSVILEQAGMQVVRRVGDAPIVPGVPAAQPAAAAMIPSGSAQG